MYYKFLDKKYVSSTIEGSLKFGRLRYYQLLEIMTGDQWIGDRNEGVARTKVTATLQEGNPEHAVLLDRLSKTGFKLGPGSSAELRDVTIRNELDCFVFCVSEGELAQLAASMSAPERAQYAYDSCLQLRDPQEIMQRLWAQGFVDGQPLPALFKSLHFGQVSYDWAERDLGDGPAASGDPFVKSSRYTEQRERRFVLVPNATIEQDGVFVQCAAISDLLVEVNRGLPARTHTPGEFDNVSENSLLEEIRSIWQTWDEEFYKIAETQHVPWEPIPRADQASWEAKWQKHTELQGQLFAKQARRFNQLSRPRLLSLYMALRSRKDFRSRHESAFAKIDRAVLLGAVPGILRNRFRKLL